MTSGPGEDRTRVASYESNASTPPRLLDLSTQNIVFSYSFQGRDFDHLPPSSDALNQHVLRATYQGGHVWGNTLIPRPNIPDPADWGWLMVSKRWQPLWIAKPVISKALKQLVRCGCTKECKNPCTCCMAGVSCTTLCKCRGRCYGKPRAIPRQE